MPVNRRAIRESTIPGRIGEFREWGAKRLPPIPVAVSGTEIPSYRRGGGGSGVLPGYTFRCGSFRADDKVALRENEQAGNVLRSEGSSPPSLGCAPPVPAGFRFPLFAHRDRPGANPGNAGISRERRKPEPPLRNQPLSGVFLRVPELLRRPFLACGRPGGGDAKTHPERLRPSPPHDPNPPPFRPEIQGAPPVGGGDSRGFRAPRPGGPEDSQPGEGEPHGRLGVPRLRGGP